MMENGPAMQQFDLGLDKRLIKACAALGYVEPTLVQSKSIPLALQGKDLLVRARTGSGKTAAYVLPALHKILKQKKNQTLTQPAIRALILVPTRELVEQVKQTVWELTAFCRESVSILALLGDNMSAQQAHLRDKPDVLVGTPGRVVAHLEAGNLTLEVTDEEAGAGGGGGGAGLETLAIDEADLMLSFGYAEDLRALVGRCPRSAQTFLLSATLGPELDALKRLALRSPVILKLEEGKTDGKLTQFYLSLPSKDKYLLLYVFLKLGLMEGKGLFFVNTTDGCYRLKLFLEQFHIQAAVLNAELPLNSRLHILQEFNRGIFDYLIATDESVDIGDGQEDSADESSSEEEKGESSDEDDEGKEGSDASDSEEEEVETEKENKPAKKKGKQQKDAMTEKMDLDSSASASKKESKKKKKKKPIKDAEYGVSRGVDFKGVAFVFNVDLPKNPTAYTHRVGRTARGGKAGVALSMVASDLQHEMDNLVAIQASQPPLPLLEGDNILSLMGTSEDTGGGGRPQPTLLNFNLKELEGFRYRVEDVSRSVTRTAVKEVRVAELKQEILNSEKLKSHFVDNPNDLKILRHDKSILHPMRKMMHLKHIPSYLIPQGLVRGGADPSLAKKKKRKRGGVRKSRDQRRRTDNDPLQNPQTAADTKVDATAANSSAKIPTNDLIFDDKEVLGRSTAGRTKW
eukprot:CAMPEP_0206397602 /NCGR_PEP_ID=MMETSP0294-20121207/23596_1 /ASSEMBLY_ACC=CAM_ASM_000327 /TAXON_ID=39354 /ORGANISM="Heterosigma akashiwo, Strain CCMP2393" /LENGTH=686 /DNA_ID=CAMNT_0053852791 /DNA_START=29 /DNA_END=2086 /DNA_ORIENTATION=-